MEATAPTVLLVHGAFADASSWNEVIAELQGDGLAVKALPHPLRGLRRDAAYVSSAARAINGPVLLVAHSYGGMVTTVAATAAPNVVGLVYVATFIPDIGENINTINGGYPATDHPPEIQPASFPIAGSGEPGVELYISESTFRSAFAADLPIEVTRVAAAAQRPPSITCFEETASGTAWTTMPSWALVATADQMIHPDAERAMAIRAGSAIVEIDASHAVPLSQSAAVADLIRAACGSLAT